LSERHAEHETINAALAAVVQRLTLVKSVDFRLVGTAAALLQGVRLPVGDVDILLKDRRGVDLFSEALADFQVLAPPYFSQESKQYYASFRVEGTEVEFSTVETPSQSDTFERVGRGPWEHFSICRCDSMEVPVVALELRLLTEVFRGRRDRYQPIAEFMREHVYQVELVQCG
jgi:hypothetical protein